MLAAFFAFPSAPALAANFNVNDEASLRSALGGDSIGGAGDGDTITFTADITLTADLPAVEADITIIGDGFTLSGDNQFRGLFVGAWVPGTATQAGVTVAIQDLTITDTKAQGGNGSGGGGGGAGLGGALFVAAQASVTVSNVSLTGNAAQGGNGSSLVSTDFGGGGGMGGNGATTNGGGGGLGVGADGGDGGTVSGPGQDGIATGASSGGKGGGVAFPPGVGAGGTAGGTAGGGGGGVGGSGAGGGVGGANGVNADGDGGAGGFGGGGGGRNVTGGMGGAGGFGGGGGSGLIGGAGGFGGGGGGSVILANPGGAGFGGGQGNVFSGTEGGGGGGMGGAVFVQEGGTLTLAGGLTVNGNTVAGGTGGNSSGATGGSAFGSGLFLQGNGTITFAPGAGQTQTVSDVIADQTGSGGTGGNAGSWSVAKTGAGTLALTGTNSYSGGTTVSAGTLTGSAASLQGAIVNNAAVTFDQALAGTYAGNMSGTGSLTKTGTGGLTLSGANTYSGGTTISAGFLQGDTDSLQGDIVNNGLVTFVQGTDGAYAGAMSGTGELDKTGAGTLTLTGTNTHAGTTSIIGGTLRVNGSVAGNVLVGPAGTLGGTGTLGSSVFASGTWAPGNSIGTQTVGGNVTFNNGSVYEVEVDSTGASDLINATGTATLNAGASVSVLAAAGTYNLTTSYTILSAAGGVTGSFGGVTSNLAFLTPALTYDPTTVFLTMTRNNVSFADTTMTRNQRSVATALDQAATDNRMSTTINALLGLTAAQANDAFDQMSGEIYADMPSINLFAGQRFMGIVGQQTAQARGGAPGALAQGTRVNLASLGAPRFGDEDTGISAGSPFPRGPWNAWMSGVGATGDVDGDGNSHTIDYSGGGGAIGIDKQVTPDLIAGIAAGYANTNLSTQAISSSGTVASYQGALYASYGRNRFHVQGLVGYAYNDNSAERTIGFPGVNAQAEGDTSANQFLSAVEGGYEVPIGRVTDMTPFLALQSTVADQASFTETGAGQLNLNVDGRTTTSVRSILGVQLDHAANVGLDRPLALLARLGWAHEYADTARPLTASFAGAPGNGFTVDGAQVARDSAVVAAGATARLADNLDFLLRYDGDVNGADNAHAVTGRLSYAF